MKQSPPNIFFSDDVLARSEHYSNAVRELFAVTGRLLSRLESHIESTREPYQDRQLRAGRVAVGGYGNDRVSGQPGLEETLVLVLGSVGLECDLVAVLDAVLLDLDDHGCGGIYVCGHRQVDGRAAYQRKQGSERLLSVEAWVAGIVESGTGEIEAQERLVVFAIRGRM